MHMHYSPNLKKAVRPTDSVLQMSFKKGGGGHELHSTPYYYQEMDVEMLTCVCLLPIIHQMYL